MKVHYINILLFALPLNILAYTHKKPSITSRHIQNTRLLCECELYIPNYDNDPEMKRVMQKFHDRTTQRFQEYDERLQEKRQICKDTCDKEIQKIILKDKLEKELTEKFATLQTDIHSDAIPTCICEKSMVDKVEKGCLRCGVVFGGGIAPSVGLLGGIGQVALSAWKTAAITSAKEAAEKAAIAEATKAAVDAVILQLKNFVNGFTGMTVNLTPIVTPTNYKCGSVLYASAKELASKYCIVKGHEMYTSFCNSVVFYDNVNGFNIFAEAGTAKYKTEFASQKALLEAAELDAVDAKYAFWQTANIAPVVAIVVIVLIMVIIYLILRYRRKKKMKKKLQYIKLLEE
ncbi:rifin [Plasmodium falciparum IGH-CR14]|uniref:Rifin n=1 Tax=Plasmodium falciparum IGH-CR14 TaxID=580059 RepID=A0A0L1I375_PLAFA|nr:rifin [Plasmodium falciparum IGH-CR14]